MSLVRLSQEHPRRYFEQIAAIHLDSIHHGALPILGMSFLGRLYLELTRVPRTGVWCILEKDRVLGFLAGSADLVRCYHSMLTRRAAPLLLSALPSLRSPALLRKLPALLLYPLRRRAGSEADSSRAELLAIALDPEARGRGLGKALVAEFEVALISWGVPEYCVMTNSAEPDSAAFYLRMGFAARGRVPHHDLILQRYWKTTAPGTLPQPPG